MVLDIESIKNKLKEQDFLGNLHSFIIFGSSIHKRTIANDTDICIVLERANDDTTTKRIAEFIFNNFEKPDYAIFLKEEIESNLPFSSLGNGLFSLEYLSRGYCIHGENIFKKKIIGMDRSKYKESILIKSFEYILRLRLVYFSLKHDDQYKFIFFQKYLTRLVRMILLYEDHVTYDHVETFSRIELLELAKNLSIIKENYDFSNITLDDYYDIFKGVCKYIVSIKDTEKK